MRNDVLIHTTESSIAHKRRGNVPSSETPFWTVSGTPRQTEPGCRIWFEADGELIATATITAVEEGAIWFEPLRDAEGEPPVEPPSRGFTYVDSEAFESAAATDA